MQELLDLMRALRDPQTGCPWDREQTMASILPHSLEEIYELVDAVERDNMEDIRDELGDLLFHVVFYTQLAAEAGHFDFTDVAAGVSKKMRRRRPHVFAGKQLDNKAQVQAEWARIKQEERNGRQPDGQEFFAGIAKALPAMARAVKLQRRAARVGFDWDAPQQVLAKIEEETEEVRQAMAAPQRPDELEAELGDLLFAVINLARLLDMDPETALRGTNARFEQRFLHMLATLEAQGEALEASSSARLEQLWQQAKQALAQQD